MERSRPDVLLCAGLDPSGGAGLIADVRVVAELGARPVGVVTALTVQNTTGVASSAPCDPEVVGDQLAFLLTDVEVQAVKIGMIGSDQIATAIANALQLTRAPVVWDPIAVPSRGNTTYIHSYDVVAEVLRPHLTVVTPNARELELLSEVTVTDLASAERAGRMVAERLDAAVLVKGGHLATSDCDDVLLYAGDREELPGLRIPSGEQIHGTGCALSSAIAAYLALGNKLPIACRLAKEYVAARLVSPACAGRGAPAVL